MNSVYWKVFKHNIKNELVWWAEKANNFCDGIRKNVDNNKESIAQYMLPYDIWFTFIEMLFDWTIKIYVVKARQRKYLLYFKKGIKKDFKLFHNSHKSLK